VVALVEQCFLNRVCKSLMQLMQQTSPHAANILCGAFQQSFSNRFYLK